MRAWLREPSLMRRTLGALGLAFVLVLLALLGHDYLETRQSYQQDRVIRIRAELLAPELAAVSEAEVAARLMTGFARMNERFRARAGLPPGVAFQQLRDAQGRVLAAYPADATEAFDVPPGDLVPLRLHGQDYVVVARQAGPWRLVLAEPVEGLAPLLGRLADDILDKLLLALPLVALPVGLALWTGLRPLRQLTAQLAARGAQDLSPLGALPPHRELRPLAAAFERLLAQLRGKLERERRFVQEAAHELRTPLAAIATQAHVLAHTEAPEARVRAEAAMTGMLERASHLSHQLLALALLDEQASPTRAQAVDLAALLEQALAAVSDQALARGLSLSLEAPDRLPAVLPLAAWQSITHNLLDNSLRYVPAGGRIEVSLARSAEGLSLRVADDGPGLPPEWQARAFDRFWRAPGQAVSGSGLGLAIVQQAARQLGGEVRIEAGLEGRGIAFVLFLPKSA